ncbi:ankyrin repeat domain-containing protein [Shigella flexneri]|nr:ankyrin repeat domain-containing protein [Shigella boydii]EFZ0030876.1 ankyrin repeat domain-containing protein [Shigella boydii]EFZ0079571.1 ankyrin repeat domain-containing protein [Shigella flexneri]HCS1417797.1 ankyrin repeat domain-containing protein [Shigella boydii]
MMSNCINDARFLDILWDEDFNAFVSEVERCNDVNIIINQNNKETLLMACCRLNYKQFVDFLLSKNTNAKNKDNHGNTALHISSYCADTDIVSALISFDKSEVNNKNKWGQTPLMLAVKRCSLDVIRMLLNSGADIREKDYKNNTVFHYLLMEHHDFDVFLTALDLLKMKNDDLYEENSDGMSVMDYIISVKNSRDDYDFKNTKYNGYFKNNSRRPR